MSKQTIPWIRIKIEQEKKKELMQSSDAKGFAQVLPQLLLTIALGILSYIAFMNWSLWLSIPIFYVYATVFAFSGYTAAIHELSHNTVFKTRWLNKLFISIFAFMSWCDPIYFRKSHFQHHAYTVYHGLDQEVVQPISVSNWRLFFKIVFDVEKLYNDSFDGVIGVIRRAFGMLKPDREAVLFENSKDRAKMIRWCRTVIIGHLLIVAAIIISQQWILLLLFSFTVFFGQWLAYLASFPQHVGLATDTPDFRKTCRIIIVGPIVGFLYWNTNYHIEHHSYAAVPFYNLKLMHEEMKPYLPESKRLLPAWKEMRQAYKKQKTDPEYFIDVDVREIE
ncbi:MAG: fatty acid desaturase [Clostridiales bacterium]|nr:fatty acid desaturase [Clostridiales bacterium]